MVPVTNLSGEPVSSRSSSAEHPFRAWRASGQIRNRFAWQTGADASARSPRGSAHHPYECTVIDARGMRITDVASNYCRALSWGQYIVWFFREFDLRAVLTAFTNSNSCAHGTVLAGDGAPRRCLRARRGRYGRHGSPTWNQRSTLASAPLQFDADAGEPSTVYLDHGTYQLRERPLFVSLVCSRRSVTRRYNSP
jgi:hypothetical protein